MRRLAALLLTAPILVDAPAAATAAAADSPRVGVLVVGTDEEDAAALEGLTRGLRLAGLADRDIDRAVLDDAATAQAALTEMRAGGVRLVVAVGREAAARAEGAVRDLPLVLARVDEAYAAELRRAGSACVAAAPSPSSLFSEMRRAIPEIRHVVALTSAGESRDFASDAVVAELAGDTPDERAAAAVAATPRADALWLSPSVPTADADALARALAGRGIAIVGSRRAHLDAGCAVVVRQDAEDVGAFAAVLAKQVLENADPAKLPVRRTSRRLLEVNLVAARRLGFRVPLTLLARADAVVRPTVSR
jgi:putative ABC transport system substrate-binding protein